MIQRTREELKKAYVEGLTFGLNSEEAAAPVMLEILLDIRDLLTPKDK